VDTLYFARGELDRTGQTVRYEYERSFPDGRPLTAASCVVPYTEGALRKVDRLLGVEKGGGADQFRARQEMITTQGCVTDGACVLDPLVVVAPPPEPSDLPPCPGCEAPFPGTSRPGGGGSDGGGSEPPSDPQDTPSDTICKTTDPVINAEPVQSAFEDLWKSSNYEVNGVVQPESQRLEQGAFIIQSGTGYSIQPFPSSWTYSPCEIVFPQDYTPPAGAVAYIHTHPYTLNEKQVACGEVLPGSGLYLNYNGKSSNGDNETSGLWGIPGYLLDAQHIARFTADQTAADVSFERCAY
jgi:hypothetical protein